MNPALESFDANMDLGVNLKRIAAILETIAERFSPTLPDTRMFRISPSGPLPTWAIKRAGYHLVKRNGVTESEYLTPYMVWCMESECIETTMLRPFRHKTAYIDTTPTGGQYVRWKRAVSYRAYVVSYWFPPSPSYSSVGQGTWACEATK